MLLKYLVAVGCIYLASCKPLAGEMDGDILGTGNKEITPGKNNFRQARIDILVDLEEVAYPIFKHIVGKQKTGNISNPRAREIANNFVTKFDNMTQHSNPPISPIAFYAMIKDFETGHPEKWSKPISAKNLAITTFQSQQTYRTKSKNKWSLTKKAPENQIFFTTNCTFGLCFGVFQVDLIGESLNKGKGGTYIFNSHSGWDPQICGPQGLDIAQFKGGMDFCSALYWWTFARSGAKCRLLAKRAHKVDKNPCNDENNQWTYKMLSYGRLAYAQQKQASWTSWPWTKQYLYYENLLVSRALGRVIKGVGGKSIAGTEIDALIQSPKPNLTRERLLAIHNSNCQLRAGIGLNDSGPRGICIPKSNFDYRKILAIRIPEDSKQRGRVTPSQIETLIAAAPSPSLQQPTQKLPTPAPIEEPLKDTDREAGTGVAADEPQPDQNESNYKPCIEYYVGKGDNIFEVAHQIRDEFFPVEKIETKFSEIKESLITKGLSHFITVNQVVDDIKNINGISDERLIQPEQILTLPFFYHDVTIGDDLEKLAKSLQIKDVPFPYFNMGGEEWIKFFNNLTDDNLEVDQSLQLYSKDHCAKQLKIMETSG